MLISRLLESAWDVRSQSAVRCAQFASQSRRISTPTTPVRCVDGIHVGLFKTSKIVIMQNTLRVKDGRTDSRPICQKVQFPCTSIFHHECHAIVNAESANGKRLRMLESHHEKHTLLCTHLHHNIENFNSDSFSVDGIHVTLFQSNRKRRYVPCDTRQTKMCGSLCSSCSVFHPRRPFTMNATPFLTRKVPTESA